MLKTSYQKMLILCILIIFAINIIPIEAETITIEIEDLEPLITTSLDRVLGTIDPTIEKFQNTTIEILSFLEDRIKINVSEILYWLETNLFLILFAVIVFFLFIFKLLDLLHDVLRKYGFTQEKRRFVAGVVITIIFVWLFVAMVLSTWPPTNEFDLQVFKYVLVGLLGLALLGLMGAWFFYWYSLMQNVENNRILVPRRPRSIIDSEAL